jgi:hypothetical protein
MRLRIISDGTPHSTRVIDEDTGEKVEGVTSVNIDINLERSIARIELLNPKIDIIADTPNEDT